MRALSGKSPEVKLFMQLVEDYREKKELNNTFDREEAKKAIEDIFLIELTLQSYMMIENKILKHNVLTSRFLSLL